MYSRPCQRAKKLRGTLGALTEPCTTAASFITLSVPPSGRVVVDHPQGPRRLRLGNWAVLEDHLGATGRLRERSHPLVVGARYQHDARPRSGVGRMAQGDCGMPAVVKTFDSRGDYRHRRVGVARPDHGLGTAGDAYHAPAGRFERGTDIRPHPLEWVNEHRDSLGRIP